MNGCRNYSEHHVAALRFAKGLRDLDLPLDLAGSLVRLANDGTCGDLRRAMLLSVEEALSDSNNRLAVLRRTRRDLLGLRRGLTGMTPGDTRIPGIAPCTCVELVSGQRRQRGAKRSAPPASPGARSV